MRRTYKVRRSDEGEVQRRRWTFYEAINIILWKGVRGQTVLGSEDFADWIYERFLSQKKVDRREFTGIKDLQTGPGTVKEIARAVSREFGEEEEGLYRPVGLLGLGR